MIVLSELTDTLAEIEEDFNVYITARFSRNKLFFRVERADRKMVTADILFMADTLDMMKASPVEHISTSLKSMAIDCYD